MEVGNPVEVWSPQNLGVSCKEGGKGGRRVEGGPQVSSFGNWKVSEYWGRADLESEQVCSRCVKSEVSTGLSVLTSRRAAEY